MLYKNKKLKKAIKQGNKDGLVSILNKITNNKEFKENVGKLNFTDEDCPSVMHYAIDNAHSNDIIKTIIDYSPESVLNTKDYLGFTPLHKTCMNHNMEIARELLNQNDYTNNIYNMDYSICDNNNRTASEYLSIEEYKYLSNLFSIELNHPGDRQRQNYNAGTANIMESDNFDYENIRQIYINNSQQGSHHNSASERTREYSFGGNYRRESISSSRGVLGENIGPLSYIATSGNLSNNENRFLR